MEPQENVINSEEMLFKRKLPYSLSEFEIINRIGEGSQGEVFEVSSKHFPDKMAMKSLKLPKHKSKTQKVLKQIKSEIIINTQIQQSDITLSKFFPKFYGYFMENQTFYLIFELCSFDVMQIYNKLKTHTQKNTFCWILLHDIIKSLSLLEKNQVIHRDIKPQNILFKDNHFKLIDFGLARYTMDEKNICLDVGNIFSKAPQVYVGVQNSKSDVWSLGITIYYLLEGKLPYDNETIQMMMEKDKIDSYIERIKHKQFFINLCQKENPKDNKMNLLSLYEVIQKMLTVSLEERLLASEINQKFLKPIEFEKICHQQIIKDIIKMQKPKNPTDLRIFLQLLILKHLEHRQTQLGLFYVICFGCIKEILRINKKLSKTHFSLQNGSNPKNQKKVLESQLLKNIKTLCFRLLQILLKQMQNSSIQSKQFIQPITSFGQIQLQIQSQKKPLHEDHEKLQAFISIFLQKYEAQFCEHDEKENIQVQKSVNEKLDQKSANFYHVLVCISDQNIENQFMGTKKSQKSKQKIKIPEISQTLKCMVNQKHPRSIKCISDQQFKKEIQNEGLQNFLKFFSKDKLRERFPLLGEMGELLKKLIDSCQDQTKMKVLISSEFRLWNLSINLSRI